jgi:hypothetical protein
MKQVVTTNRREVSSAPSYDLRESLTLIDAFAFRMTIEVGSRE